MKVLNLNGDIEQIKELNLREYELDYPYQKNQKLVDEKYWRVNTNAMLNPDKENFALKYPFIGKYQFVYDKYSAGLYCRIRPLPVKSCIAFQDEPYCYPECWDATSLREMKFLSGFNHIITHGGYSSKEEVKKWMEEVTPYIRNFHFQDVNPNSGYSNINITIRERSEEEKIAYDNAKTLAAALAVGVEESPQIGSFPTIDLIEPGDLIKIEVDTWKEETMKHEEPIAVKPATGNYCLVVEDKEADNEYLPIEVHYNKTDDEINDLATNLLKTYNEAVFDIQNYSGSVTIRELGKEIASVTCAVEVVHKTSWFRFAEHKTDAESAPGISEDAPKANGADKSYAAEKDIHAAYTGTY